jgi:hypothetical protein
MYVCRFVCLNIPTLGQYGFHNLQCIYVCVHMPLGRLSLASLHAYMHTYTHIYMKALHYSHHAACRMLAFSSYTYIHSFIHSYVHTYIATYMQTYIHTSATTCVKLTHAAYHARDRFAFCSPCTDDLVCLLQTPCLHCLRMYVCMNEYVCVREWIYVYVCVYVHIVTWICMYNYIILCVYSKHLAWNSSCVYVCT